MDMEVDKAQLKNIVKYITGTCEGKMNISTVYRVWRQRCAPVLYITAIIIPAHNNRGNKGCFVSLSTFIYKKKTKTHIHTCAD